MQVSFRQSGGVPGIVRGVDLDTSRLAAPVAERLEQLVAASGIRGQSERVSRVARDLRQYEIVIRRESDVASLVCDDVSVPRKVRPLLRFLDEQSGPLVP